MKLIEEISKFYCIKTEMLEKSISKSHSCYKRIVIKQKNGKDRVVFAPNITIKMCQKFILKHYLEKLPYSELAFAYTKKRSVLDCAKLHIGNTHFLHVDIKNFFDNMTWHVFCKIVSEKYSNTEFAKLLERENDILKSILCRNNTFCQGAITSPYVSNIFLSHFDDVMKKYVSENGNPCIYSRYSDDIYISSKNIIDCSIIDYIRNALSQYRLRINYKKVRFASLNDSTSILGLTLKKNSTITINTRTKSKIKSMIYQYIKCPKESDKNKIIGYTIYAMMVDPTFLVSLKRKYDMSDLTHSK